MRYRQCFIAAVLVVSALASTSRAVGTFTIINFPGGAPYTATAVFGINDLGKIVGTYYDAGVRGFLLDHGTFTTIDFPGATGTSAQGINNGRQIVGTYSAGHSAPLELGFLLDRGTFKSIQVGPVYTAAVGINDHGEIVGTRSSGGVDRSFLMDHSTLTSIDVPGGIYIFAQAINNHRQIVGDYTDDNGFHSFRLD